MSEEKTNNRFVVFYDVAFKQYAIRDLDKGLVGFIPKAADWLNEQQAELAKLRAEVARLKAEREWLPIETAPDDVPHVRGLWMHYRTPTDLFAVQWQQDAGYIDDDGDFVNDDGEPHGWQAADYTHWQPLPPPPTEEKQ